MKGTTKGAKVGGGGSKGRDAEVEERGKDGRRWARGLVRGGAGGGDGG